MLQCDYKTDKKPIKIIKISKIEKIGEGKKFGGIKRGIKAITKNKFNIFS
ncbi:hypothetical protein XIS1_1700095 [Xenorhabdus innexi]|uniref:Uncharacterized protein n=1 Tax=Xenorhabdus innexi TaxID=290109 RepID=A0A1N6MW98_9GAMM|nr:hypothetical protein XIS1_1700095 [Xenorhabdus innexi]